MLLGVLLKNAVGDNSGFALLMLAVMIAAWFGGFWPGVVVTAAGAFAGTYFVLPPYHSLEFADISSGGIRLGVFALEGTAIRYVASRLLLRRKRAEATAQQANEILDNIADAFLGIDRDLRLVYLNSAAKRLLRKPSTDAVGRSIDDWGISFERRLDRALAEVLEGRGRASLEVRDSASAKRYEVHIYPSRAGASLCKKIRDECCAWQQIEVYIRAHSEVQFSHGLCPSCARALLPRT